MTTTNTHITDEQNIQDLKKEMDAVINNLNQSIVDIADAAGKLDAIDKELDEADGLLTNLYDEVSDFEDEKGDEIDALIVNALVEEETEGDK